MTESDHKCPRCGTPLKVVTVRKPVYEDVPVLERSYTVKGLKGYEDAEEVADCVRCTGGY
jgi:hypothetical protein